MNPLEQNPYKGFKPDDFPSTPWSDGYGSTDPVFEQLLAQIKPNFIVEVGSWKGGSAIHMAQIAKRLGLKCQILCIDTWLGTTDQMDNAACLDDLGLRFGYPTLYYKFLANVVRAGVQDYIKPFPQTSLIAARWLQQQSVRPQLVYVDANHDTEDVLNDLNAYWPLVAADGVLLGDDWTWASVRKAVQTYFTMNIVAVAGTNKYYVKK